MPLKVIIITILMEHSSDNFSEIMFLEIISLVFLDSCRIFKISYDIMHKYQESYWQQPQAS